QETEYWLAQSPTVALPIDVPGIENRVEDELEVWTSLNAAETESLIQKTSAAYHTQINDLLLTALLQAFEPWTQERSLHVEMEGHGREELFEGTDLSRTVGWFTSLYPVHLELSPID